jgi:hypothetical protein
MAATVELWEAEGRWWWAFKDGEVEIASNHPYATERQAGEAARLAYPDVPVTGANKAARSDEGPVSFAACVLMCVSIWRHYRPRKRA